MSHKSTYEIAFARRTEEKTDYRKRLALLKSGKHRLVIRKSNNNIIVQVIKYNENGDETLASANSKELKKLGWKLHSGNIPAAYLAGYLCGKRARQKGVTEIVADIGLNSSVHGSRVFSALKGAIDAGISTNAGEGVFPQLERISGKHISQEAEKMFEEAKKAIEKKFGEKQ